MHRINYAAYLTLSCLILSCAGSGNKKEGEKQEIKGFKQTSYLVENFTGSNEVRTMGNQFVMPVNGKAIKVDYSIQYPNGNLAEATEEIQLVLPEIFKKYEAIDYTDTVLTDGEGYGKTKVFFNDQGQIDKYQYFISDVDVEATLNITYDEHGNYSQLHWKSIDERSGVESDYYIDRENAYSDIVPEVTEEDFMTVNGKSIFSKEKRNILDYYLLARAASIFNPAHMGGHFDLKNGYFEISDEGTGAGMYTGQLVLFRTNDGRDIIGISGFFGEAVSYFTISGDRPKFYEYQDGVFKPIDQILPDASVRDFFNQNPSNPIEGIPTYYVLPQKGLNVTYKIDPNLGAFCNDLIEDHGSYDRYVSICQTYNLLDKKEIQFKFDKESGTFISLDEK